MTFGAIKARITDELVRPDLSAQIALAVADAIKEAATYRFYFNEVRGLTFNTVPGQRFYDATALASIPLISRIDALWVTVNGQRRELCLANALDLADWDDGQNEPLGEPAYYARQANGLLLWMPPRLAYAIGIDGTTRFAPLVNDADENPYLTEGELYVRALAKAYLLEDVIRDAAAADRQWAKADREKRNLIAETGSRNATNRLRSFA